jgi:hypothetical protein
MEVPLLMEEAVSDVMPADKMLLPGAKVSTHVPQLLNDDLASELVVAPTVIAFGTKAGDVVQASALSLPAATTTGTP